MASLPTGSVIGRFFGRTASEGAAFAFGVASAPVLRPAVEKIVQESWSTYPDRALDAHTAALIVAEDVERESWGVSEARLSGVNADRLRELVQEALNAPGVPELLTLRRRGLIDAAAFEHGLRKAKLEPRWNDAIDGLREVLLSPSELANARQQGFISPDRQRAEAGLQGLDAERAEIQYELAGLPPGVETALDMLRRGIIDEARFAEMVREGHTKTKYTAELLATRSRVNRVLDFVQGHLRGWLTQDEMYAGAQLTGYDQADVDLLFKIHGRPLSFRQVFIGRRRGGDYDGPIDQLDPAFLTSLRQSDVRPEWYNLAWAQRYTYPSAFVLRGLTQSGDLTAAECERVLLFEGWEPGFAHTVAQRWAGSSSSSGKSLTRAELLAEYEGSYISEAQYRAALEQLGYSGQALELELELGNARRVRKYRDAVVNAAHDAYLDHEIDETAASGELAGVGVVGEAAQHLLAVWDKERGARVRSLTPAQLVKGYKRSILTADVVHERLMDQGYSDADATTLIREA